MPGPSRRVVVIGGDLAGLAAAARLAKAGHHVTLIEQSDHLGGDWAGDLAPNVLSFPAPWRDLFRKSGRPLEEECRRAGLELVAAPATRHTFADGSVLDLPTGRGDQHEAIARLYGERAAVAWRDLVDALAGVWQQLRFLGLETELRDPAALDRRTRSALWSDRSLADLATALPEHRLRTIVADLGYVEGSSPEQTPAFCAVSLYVDQTFGRWMLAPNGSADGDQVPVSLAVLVGLLIQRLALRRVDVRLRTEVAAIETDRRGVRAVHLTPADHPTGAPADEALAADAVVVCADPWRLYREWLADLRGSRPFRDERTMLTRAAAALRPELTALPEPEAVSERGRTIAICRHQVGGAPTLETRHADSTGSGRTLADFSVARPDVSAGIRWQGFSSWPRRASVVSALPGLFLAGPWCHAGQGPDRVVLSAALAAAATQRFLDAS